MMELETINKLYLEMSQFTTAKTRLNLSDEALLRMCRDMLVSAWYDNAQDQGDCGDLLAELDKRLGELK